MLTLFDAAGSIGSKFVTEQNLIRPTNRANPYTSYYENASPTPASFCTLFDLSGRIWPGS
jgi:hypothetical protein